MNRFVGFCPNASMEGGFVDVWPKANINGGLCARGLLLDFYSPQDAEQIADGHFGSLCHGDDFGHLVLIQGHAPIDPRCLDDGIFAAFQRVIKVCATQRPGRAGGKRRGCFFVPPPCCINSTRWLEIKEKSFVITANFCCRAQPCGPSFISVDNLAAD